jgi:hypothetical protein
VVKDWRQMHIRMHFQRELRKRSKGIGKKLRVRAAEKGLEKLRV